MKREKILEYFRNQGHDHVVKADLTYIRVMTSNVLHTDARNSQSYELSYEERADILAAMYLYFQPDFIGLQEVSAPMQAALTERFSDVYAFVDTPLGDYENYCYHGVRSKQNVTPVIYNKNLYEVLDSRYHLFDVLGLWSYQWARYRSKKDPSQRFIHMNLHYHYDGNQQMPGVIDVNNELTHLRRHYPKVPIFVTGDYNFQYTHKQYEVMVQGLGMQSGMLVAEDIEPNGRDYWCHLLGSTELQKNGSAIDHITVTEDLVNVKLHRVLYDELLCKSSDHCARFLDLELKNTESKK